MRGRNTHYTWEKLKCIQSFCRKTCREEQLGRSERRWKNNINELSVLIVDWTNLTQDTGQWRTPADTVMNLRFKKTLDSSLFSELSLLASGDKLVLGT
jgi:hypothetical protein